jgi:hypothetical protein
MKYLVRFIIVKILMLIDRDPIARFNHIGAVATGIKEK